MAMPLHLVFLTPSPDPAGGGRAFNESMIPALRAAGHTVHVRHDAASLPEGALPVVDGLLLPDLAPQLDALVARDAVVVVHHVGARAGRDAALRDAVHATERRMLPAFRRVLTTSGPLMERLASEFGVAPLLVPPGLPDLPRGVQSVDGPCRILSVGVLTPRKGHDRLLQALARLMDLDWTLTIAGDAGRDAVHAGSIQALIETLGLGGRVTLLADPAAEALDVAWCSADLFASATRWEGYPAGIAGALRRGIPVLATRIPGIEALVPTAAGVLVPPDDAMTLSKCLRRAVFDADLRQGLAEGAWQAGMALPGWPQQALAFATLLRS